MNLYEEVYKEGMVSEGTLDKMGIPSDVNSNGDLVCRDFDITSENCQRSKCLSAPSQILARRRVVFDRKHSLYCKVLKLYETETKEYELNGQCEMKLMAIFDEWRQSQRNNNASNKSTLHVPEYFDCFHAMSDRITYNMIANYKGGIKISK